MSQAWCKVVSKKPGAVQQQTGYTPHIAVVLRMLNRLDVAVRRWWAQPGLNLRRRFTLPGFQFGAGLLFRAPLPNGGDSVPPDGTRLRLAVAPQC